MKKQLILAFVMGLVLIIPNSCNEDQLNLDPNSDTEDSYFQTEDQFQRAVYGIYSKLSDQYWYRAGSSALPMMLLPGDDITTLGQDAFEVFSTINPTEDRLTYVYRALYQQISRACIFVDKNEEVADGIYVTPGLKDYNRGEALFLRAYAYYLLWNYYGTAPLITTRLTTIDDVTPPNSTGTELLDQAILDLTEAATLLPSSWPSSDRGRVTKNSANGLLGKTLVFRGSATGNSADYTAAIAAFNNISGVSLVAAYDDNFAADTENNNESLFEFQATQAFALDNIWLDNDFDNAVGSLSVYWGFYSNDGYLFGKQPFIATTKLKNMFEPGDPRLSLSLDATTLAFRKYVTRNTTVQVGGASVNNHRILRYADVLLLKAEAINESNGSTSEAIGLINQVRTRARGAGSSPADRSTSETNRATIRQWIMDERLMELAGEGQRWFDLRRWAMAGTLTLNNAFFSSAIPSVMSFNPEKNLNFPIPFDETSQNPNVNQNPGY